MGSQYSVFSTQARPRGAAARSVLTSVVRAIMPEDPGLPDARVDVTVNIQLSVGEYQSEDGGSVLTLLGAR